MTPRDRLIVALDFPSGTPALDLVDRIGDAVLWYKVGLELYLAEGEGVVHDLRSRGKQVFLDLKLHDIPNTVAGAVHSASRCGAGLLTLHAAGGPAMLQAAVKAATELNAAGESTPRLLAVTVLTSMDAAQLHAIGVDRSPADQVMLLGRIAMESGVHGLVCSPEEVHALRHAGGPDPLLVVPGIRSGSDASDDQRRTASASETLHRGASMLVVGRPITRAADPVAAAQSLLRQIEA